MTWTTYYNLKTAPPPPTHTVTADPPPTHTVKSQDHPTPASTHTRTPTAATADNNTSDKAGANPSGVRAEAEEYLEVWSSTKLCMIM
jgi:hypothetical protein